MGLDTLLLSRDSLEKWLEGEVAGGGGAGAARMPPNGANGLPGPLPPGYAPPPEGQSVPPLAPHDTPPTDTTSENNEQHGQVKNTSIRIYKTLPMASPKVRSSHFKK